MSSPPAHPIESIHIERAAFTNNTVSISGTANSPRSLITQVTVNGQSTRLVNNHFEASLPSADPTVTIIATNAAGSTKELTETLGSPVTVHIARAIRDGDIVKVSGFVTSDASPITNLTIAGQTFELTDNRFNAEVPATTLVKITARNASNGRDALTLNFSDDAPEHGIALKIRDSGFSGTATLIEGLLENAKEDIASLVSGIATGITIDTSVIKLAFTDVSTSVSDNIQLNLVPNESDNKLDLGIEAQISEIRIQAGLDTQICLIWCTKPFIIPIDMSLGDVIVAGSLFISPSDADENTKKKFVDLDAELSASVGSNHLYLFNATSRSFLIGEIVKLVVESQVNGVISNLIQNDVANILNVIPTKIPALLVDNDNGVSELIDGIGILPIFKMLVRGIGATVGISDALSTSQEAIIVLDANLITETADSRVKFGYLTRQLPRSDADLIAIQPNQPQPAIGTLVIDSDVLNKTFSALNQASLMDFTLPLLDINTIIEHNALNGISEQLLDKTLTLRVYSRNGTPYFATPKNSEDIIALELNDYVLELSVDDEPLLAINLNMVANANVGITDNTFTFSSLRTSHNILGVTLQGEPIDEFDMGLLVDTLSFIAAEKVLGLMSVLPLPTLPGETLLSVNTWRVNSDSADIALSLHFERLRPEANAAAEDLLASNDSDSENTETHGNNGIDSSEMDDPEIDDPEIGSGNSDTGTGVDIQLPQVLVDILRSIGSIFTQIGDNPQDEHAPTEGIDIGHPNTNQPHIPAINRQTVAIKNANFTRSRMSDVRLTRDGRLGVSAFGLTLTLQKPETINQPFVASKEPLLITDQEFSISPIYQESVFLEGQNVSGGSSAICDPDPQYVSGGKKENPYACGVGGKDDCYDVSIVSTDILEQDSTFGDLLPVLDRDQIKVSKSQMHSVPVTVRIENPKSVDAKIADVTVLGPAKVSNSFSSILFEMAIPFDGRLFITRISGRALTWYNENTDLYVNGAYDAVYAVLPEDADACDISQFTEFKPLSHAPYDAEMTRYKFAAYPFRDPAGNKIEDGAEMKGTYPWISMDGSMVSLTTIGDSRLFPRHHINGDPMSRYPSRCLDDQPECSIDTRADVQFRSLDAGFVLFGLWTQGKMVLIDNLLNESDFKLGGFGGDKEHSLVSLYAPGTGLAGDESGEIEVGETREATTRDEYGTKNSYGAALGNGTIFDSVTNRLNFWKTIKPITPRDVVWTVSSGRQTDELAFDDYLNPDGFIVSNMAGALDSDNNNDISMTYFDGWNQADLDFTNPVRVQNSATALPYVWDIPQYGDVHFGRLEPTATGGVKGKGLWFDGGQVYLSYVINEQPQAISKKPWFTTLFIDPRFDNDTVARELIHFPDGSQLTLVGLHAIQYRNSDAAVIRTIPLATPLNAIEWTQIALQSAPGNKHIQLYINGFLLDNWAHTDPIFQYTAGELTLGGKGGSSSNSQPFKGWMDEFKVFAQATNPEVVCNHAKGTLVGLNSDYNGVLKAQADAYPLASHGKVSHTLKGYGRPTFPQYACYFNNTEDYAAHLQNIPTDVTALRESFTFPEGPLYHDMPRPDSLNNQFCLSCHHENGKGGLDLPALQRNVDVLAKYDHRRQPMQPPARVGGYLPINWLPGSDDYDQQTPDEGMPFDELVMASAHDKTPSITGITLVNADTGMDVMPLVDGSVLPLDRLPSNLAIRIVTNGITESVEVDFNGSNLYLESPYALFGTHTTAAGKRNYLPADLPAEEYTLSAQATGSTQAALTIRFNVTGEPLTTEEQEETQVTETPEDERSLLQSIIDFFVTLYESMTSYAS